MSELSRIAGDISSKLMAALIVEQYQLILNEVLLKPDKKDSKNKLKEFLDSQSQKKRLFIYSKSATEKRHHWIRKFNDEPMARAALDIIDNAINQLAIEMVLHEREHILGLSELYTRFYEWPAYLSSEQRLALTYFMPWAEWLKTDRYLASKCFEAIIGFPVMIFKSESYRAVPLETLVDRWVLDHTDMIGGKLIDGTNKYIVAIGPVEKHEIEHMLPGSPKRRFWEEVLFPVFLPAHKELRTMVYVKKNDRDFKIPGVNEVSGVGINSYVS